MRQSRESKRGASRFALFWYIKIAGKNGSTAAPRVLTFDGYRGWLPALFPLHLLELGHRIVALGITETKIADEFPFRRNLEKPGDYFWVEDGHPTHANASGTRREPDRMYCRYRGIVDHFRHGAAPEAMALRRRSIGKHRKVAWRLFQTGKLQSRVETGTFVILRSQCLGIAAFKIAPDGSAPRCIVDNHEAPRLAQAHRRSKTRQIDKGFDCAVGQRIATKAPNVAPPQQKLAQLRGESSVESDGCFYRHAGASIYSTPASRKEAIARSSRRHCRSFAGKPKRSHCEWSAKARTQMPAPPKR